MQAPHPNLLQGISVILLFGIFVRKALTRCSLISLMINSLYLCKNILPDT